QRTRESGRVPTDHREALGPSLGGGAGRSTAWRADRRGHELLVRARAHGGDRAAAIGVAFFMHEEPREGVAESAENVPKRSYVGTLGAGIREVFDKPVPRTLFVFSAVTAAAAAGPL